MKKIAALLSLLIFKAPYAFAAAGSVSIALKDPLGCGTRGFADCIVPRIIDGLFAISIPIVTIMVLYGGFLIMTGGGAPERIKTGRSVILYAAVGFIVILLSKSVVFIIQKAFGV